MATAVVAVVVLASTLFGVACRGERGGRQAQPDSTEPAILFFGNSITKGQGVKIADAFPALIQEEVDAAGFELRCLNAGISGETTAGGLARVSRYLDPPPRLAVVELGANDVFRGIDRRHTYENLEAIVEAFQQAGARVILAGTTFPGVHPAHGLAMGRMYQQVAENTGALLIPDLLDGVAGVADLNLPDFIHPNARGHERLAETAWPFVEEALYEVSSARRR